MGQCDKVYPEKSFELPISLQFVVVMRPGYISCPFLMKKKSDTTQGTLFFLVAVQSHFTLGCIRCNGKTQLRGIICKFKVNESYLES